MKLTIARKEVDALIRGSFDLPSDAEVEIVNEANRHHWIINTQTDCEHPLDIHRDELVDIVDSNGDARLGLKAWVARGVWLGT